MQVQQKSYTQKFQQQSYNKLSSLTTYYSSKLINKTIILFVLSPPLFKKMFFLSLFLSSLSFLSFLPIRIFFFFSLLLLYFLLLSSGPFLSSSSFFLFFFSLSFLILYSVLFSFFFFPLSLLTDSLSLSPVDHGGGGSWIVTEIWFGFG